MAMFLWVEKGAKMKFEMLACAGHSVELPMCCIRGHPLLSQALAPELLKQSPGATGSSPSLESSL